jgi:hypothetical protein
MRRANGPRAAQLAIGRVSRETANHTRAGLEQGRAERLFGLQTRMFNETKKTYARVRIGVHSRQVGALLGAAL